MQRIEKIQRSYGSVVYFVTVKYNSRLLKFLKMFGFVGNRFIALTIWNTIHVAEGIGKLSDQSFNHEFKHVLQWHEMGRFKFIVKYFYFMIKYGYDQHPIEQEARKFAEEPQR